MAADRSYRFFFFGRTSFNSLPEREQAIAMECARLGHGVDFIEIPPSLGGKAHTAFNRVFSPLSLDIGFAFDDEIPGLRIHTPPTLPTGYRNSLTPAIDRILFRKWFQSRFRDVDFSQVIGMVMMPLWWGNFIDRTFFNPRVLVYDICDALEVQSRSDDTLSRLSAAETMLGHEASLITYSAQEMRDGVCRRFAHADIHYLPNAVSRDFIARIDAEPIIRQNGSPCSVGFIGTTNSKWFDEGLVLATIRACTECHFSIIGPVDRRFAAVCSRYPNVTLHGFVGHKNLASHLRRFNVAIIPFLDNDITRIVNPLKLYEYSAAGLPVVATRTAELTHHASLIYLAQDRESFVSAIHRAVREDTAELRNARRKFAEHHTWGERVRALLGHLHKQGIAA